MYTNLRRLEHYFLPGKLFNTAFLSVQYLLSITPATLPVSKATRQSAVGPFCPGKN